MTEEDNNIAPETEAPTKGGGLNNAEPARGEVVGAAAAVYASTEHVHAKPMTRAQYNDYRGWDVPADEEGGDTGYLLERIGGAAPSNHPEHEGYISWVTEAVFKSGYVQVPGPAEANFRSKFTGSKRV